MLIKPGVQKRLEESVQVAAKLTDGIVVVSIVDGDERLYSEKMACPDCGISIPALEPRSFSFNSAYGACTQCHGLGTRSEIDPARIVTSPELPINEQDPFPADGSISNYLRDVMKAYAAQSGITADKPFADLPQKAQDAFFRGSKEKLAMRYGAYEYKTEWKGAVAYLNARAEEIRSESAVAIFESLISSVVCPECLGRRLQPASLGVRVAGRTISDYTALPIAEAVKVFNEVKLTPREEKIAGLILREIRQRIRFLDTVGLGYLTLDRTSSTLSGGEGQRIRLATQIGSQLRGVLYVLDEPSIGLHPRDNLKLLDTLERLRDLGNTVLVVEHDEETIRRADHVVDLGPGAGAHGGLLVAQGTPEQIAASSESLTGRYIAGELSIPLPGLRRATNGKFLTVVGARANNLKNIDVSFPLGLFVAVTGVSGSGKSTLVEDILYRALARKIYRSLKEPGEHTEVLGLEHVDKIIEIDQSPIGRTPRSNPATYTGVFTPIRELYAMTPESRERGYKPGRFSFNVKGGRCEACQGDGLKCIEMNFLPDVYVLCDVCRGARYNRETLSVKFKGKSIAELLDTTVEEALPVLENIPQVKSKLQTLMDVGLGYIKLGQSATTLSGGEAQRIKLAKELSKRATGRTIYILDEPTTGLHFEDVRKLLDVLHQLVSLGNTVVVVEHNLDVIKSADWVIDLGPEGGEAGGRTVAEGTPEEVARSRRSHTGQALRPLLNGRNRKAGQAPHP
jgi:excinuclease ABC subunit A